MVAVATVIQQDDRIALIRRATEPSLGLWAFPGGVVELGESLRDAARREAWEETGLDVDVGEIVAVVEHVVRDEHGQIRYHYVIIDYEAHPIGGALRPDTDASETCWAGLEELDFLPMTDKAREVAHQILYRHAMGV